MQTLFHARPSAAAAPSVARRTALAVTGVLACALPTVFTVNLTRMLLVGEQSGHRFHQLTGQGLVLCLLWLASVVPLLRAGWHGRRPPTATGMLHLCFMAIGTAFAVAAPQGGALFLMAVIGLTGALVWLALPVRPRLRGELRVDPLLAPLGILLAAVSMPYAVAQVGLQHAATGHHAQNPHFFDMAWFAMTLSVVVVLAALRPDVRSLAVGGGAAAAFTGAVGLVLDADVPWTASALVLGCLVLAVATVTASRSERPEEAPPVI